MQSNFTRALLIKKTVKELKDLAKTYGIDGAYRLNKKDLVDYILDILNERAKADIDNQKKDADKQTYNNYDNKTAEIEEKEENKKNDTVEVKGILEVLPEGYGFVRAKNYTSSDEDFYISPVQIKRFLLKTGDEIEGLIRPNDENENKFKAIIYVNSVNGDKPEVCFKRKNFDDLVPEYPNQIIKLESDKETISTRIIDLLCPIGKGQRGLIVSPPKAGKTTLIKSIANSLNLNHPDIELLILLIDERPEEVTDMKSSVKGEIVYSTFDEDVNNHIKVAQMTLERAKRLVEHGRDVVILLDSITRLARAYNMIIPTSGRVLSGGLDPGALYGPKKFFGAARNFGKYGSLTILATALIDTGSRMDDVIYEEFKGTGNMEIHLDRDLANVRIYPAIDLINSGTRKEELLLSEKELYVSEKLRKIMDKNMSSQNLENIKSMMMKYDNNKEFIDSLSAKLNTEK